MNARGGRGLALLLLMLAAMLAFGERIARAVEAVANPIVATVNGIAIDANAVRWEMVRRGADFLPSFAAPEAKEAVVEELVRIEVLAQKAREEGYADDPEIRRSINRLLADEYWRDQVAAAQVPAATTEDARAYYDAHPVEFTEPKKSRGAVIALRWPSSASEAQRAATRARAKEIAAKAQGSTQNSFAALVAAHSEDPAGRRSAGDTGFVVEGTSVFRFEPPIVEALFEIDRVGGITTVEGERGVYVVRLGAREGGTVTPFEAVESSLREKLTRARRQKAEEERYAALRQQVKVAIDRKALLEVGPQDLSASARPPAFPVGETAP